MADRAPSTPPEIAGYSYLRPLGVGGFADVFLYEQDMPRRLAAVKVLLDDVVTDQFLHMFMAEANAMAQLSTHPSILTIYQASISSDGICRITSFVEISITRTTVVPDSLSILNWTALLMGLMNSSVTFDS